MCWLHYINYLSRKGAFERQHYEIIDTCFVGILTIKTTRKSKQTKLFPCKDPHCFPLSPLERQLYDFVIVHSCNTRRKALSSNDDQNTACIFELFRFQVVGGYVKLLISCVKGEENWFHGQAGRDVWDTEL